MIVEAPWDADTVLALNVYQGRPDVHPFTCPNRSPVDHSMHDRGDFGVLHATPRGWVCRDCWYVQNWAYQYQIQYAYLPVFSR